MFWGVKGLLQGIRGHNLAAFSGTTQATADMGFAALISIGKPRKPVLITNAVNHSEYRNSVFSSSYFGVYQWGVVDSEPHIGWVLLSSLSGPPMIAKFF